ncbi:YndJ family protein [Halobacillus litoralis]|uniref:YndJ family protein n=1 Tax=Halobacillus litoralis TaxID=45668 RepID=UPI001CD57C3F|nr:YndJ family protein [Halobacillus litoralis]MCA0972568.1 YndJ family protein [Halobacillus litoralis]
MGNAGRLVSLIGAGLFIAWIFTFHVTGIEAALGFSFLVLVPLLVEEVIKEKGNRAERWLYKALQASLPFAVAGAISVTLTPGKEAGWWAIVWFIYTLLLALGGLLRVLGRGLRPLEETVIDIGLIYIAIGGGWLVISQAGWSPYLPYSQTIVQLTAIHFHYAAFVLPLAVGFFGRFRAEANRVRKTYMNRPYAILVAGVLAGPFLVAIGLDFGPPVEVFTVGFYVLILVWLSVWWFWISVELPSWASSAVRLASFLLVGTMGLSFTYSLGLMSEAFSVSIRQMVSYHGLINAFAFSLLVTWAFRRTASPQRHSYTTFPISKIRSKGYVGSEAVYKQGWSASYQMEKGLIPTWATYRSERFDPSSIHPEVRRFYLETDQYDMKADVKWQKGFRKLSRVSHRITSRMGQINLPTSTSMNMTGEIVPVSDQLDGRPQVRAWVRKNEATEEPVFTALYSYHKQSGETYMNIALPLPIGTMTGVLKPEKDGGDGLILTSHLRPDSRGDEGVYLTFGNWTVRTPIREWFHVQVQGDRLVAVHNMSLWSIPFLTISYQLMKKEPDS